MVDSNTQNMNHPAFWVQSLKWTDETDLDYSNSIQADLRLPIQDAVVNPQRVRSL